MKQIKEIRSSYWFLRKNEKTGAYEKCTQEFEIIDVFDVNGRYVGGFEPGFDDCIPDYIKLEFDDRGNNIKVSGRCLCIFDEGACDTVERKYDSENHLLSQLACRGEGKNHLILKDIYEYDGKGRITLHENHDNTHGMGYWIEGKRCTYDGDGNCIEEYVGKHNLMTGELDYSLKVKRVYEDGRLMRVLYSPDKDGNTVDVDVYAYNEDGKVVSVVNEYRHKNVDYAYKDGKLAQWVKVYYCDIAMRGDVPNLNFLYDENSEGEDDMRENWDSDGNRFRVEETCTYDGNDKKTVMCFKECVEIMPEVTKQVKDKKVFTDINTNDCSKEEDDDISIFFSDEEDNDFWDDFITYPEKTYDLAENGRSWTIVKKECTVGNTVTVCFSKVLEDGMQELRKKVVTMDEKGNPVSIVVCVDGVETYRCEYVWENDIWISNIVHDNGSHTLVEREIISYWE